MWRSCGCARYWGWIYVRRATLLDKFGRNFLILTGWRPNSSADSLPTGASGAPPPPPPPARDRRLRILAQTAYRSSHGWPGAPLLPHDQPNTRSIIISGQFSSFFSETLLLCWESIALSPHCVILWVLILMPNLPILFYAWFLAQIASVNGNTVRWSIFADTHIWSSNHMCPSPNEHEHVSLLDN